jgi:UDP-N-acetylglucosamine diphosphorylase/glucosamine-1-phosphate N-acetyltransferase
MFDKYKIGNLILFESDNTPDFEPFNIMHPIWEMRIGAFRIFEKYLKIFDNPNIYYKGREDQSNSFIKRFNYKKEDFTKKNTLIIDASILPSGDFFDSLFDTYSEFIENLPNKTVQFTKDGKPFGVYIPAEEVFNPNPNEFEFLLKFMTDFGGVVPKIELDDAPRLNYLWDTLDTVSNQINEDFAYFNENHISEFENTRHLAFINSKKIYIGKNVKISPFVVIDASEGDVIISDNVKIMPHSTLTGPLFIGQNTIIKTGAKIYEKTAIGEFCKIGGEIENTIIQSYSNKQHEGFLGHSFICEWVNLGADTNNSDLKNTYGNIKMRLSHKTVDSKRMFLGLICGDHTKSAINTQFNTGTIAGICGVLFDSGFLKTNISSFAWGGGLSAKTYLIENAIETAKIVLSRRNKELTEEELKIITHEYNKVTKQI